ncbi:MAG: ribonucleotide reductase subunit alpha [Giesbergeria sp.]|nr:ribonucleotide reductase subunit alpha [Giesbergeria sp.]
MEITSFDDLLKAAHAQPEPQRLLFVFAGAELPDDATPAQRADFEAGHGGALVPRMCVDKAPHELGSFAALVNEAAQFDQGEWDMVFAAALPGTQHHAPTSADAEAPLQAMVEAIRAGQIGNFIPFNRQGEPVQLG